MEKVKVAVIGPGNIGQDLIAKLERSKYLKTACVINIAESEGLKKAREMGIECSSSGVNYLMENNKNDIKIAFDCTSAAAHMENAPKLKAAGIFAIDLTPAAIGPYCIPAANMDEKMLELDNVNLVTCAGQATVPIVAAISEAVPNGLRYAEIISSISSKSAGPGTRANIDEFTHTTRKALENIGGAKRAKAIIVLNPAEPPILMRNTIHAQLDKVDLKAVQDAVSRCVDKIKQYVPGYRLLLEPTILRDNIVTTIVEVEGMGDYLPVYSGNLDIITAAAVQIGEAKAKQILGVNS